LCGIIGIWSKNIQGLSQLDRMDEAVKSLHHRGPDGSGYKIYSNCAFGHTRLSILDIDERSNQPFCSEDGRYTLVFNGEIYNYQVLRNRLIEEGIQFRTSSDTEVLFQLLIQKGEEALHLLDGFFAFAFYDALENDMLIGRDRLGIKPLIVYEDAKSLIFSSELASLYTFEIDKTLDQEALNAYFAFTYIPAPKTILKYARKLLPGSLIRIKNETLVERNYYKPSAQLSALTYEESKSKIRAGLTASVHNRLVSDVALGSFLSGGLDSSIIAALAIQNKPDLKTFSIGFDHPFFDESKYAIELAKHIGSQHFDFKLNQEDFSENFTSFLDTIDEPFADSSAFAMYMLSIKTKEHVTVALSGDGADELAGGYRKHFAEFQTRQFSTIKKIGLKIAASLGRSLPVSRSGKWGDLNRKLQKLARGLNHSPATRYWNWCQFIPSDDRQKLLGKSYLKLVNPFTHHKFDGLNEVLKADQEMVLPNDMLKKVDLMSMSQGLEVRTPFLAHDFVELMNSLPETYKLNKEGGKRILRDSFGDLLPRSILDRSKKGFEIPIKEWLNHELENLLNGPLFEKEYIQKQGLFETDYLDLIKAKWNDSDFGDRIYLVWALIVFQSWYSRYYPSAKND